MSSSARMAAKSMFAPRERIRRLGTGPGYDARPTDAGRSGRTEAVGDNRTLSDQQQSNIRTAAALAFNHDRARLRSIRFSPRLLLRRRHAGHGDPARPVSGRAPARSRPGAGRRAPVPVRGYVASNLAVPG